MATLKPNSTYNMNGVTVKEKIIPDGTVWKSATKAARAGFAAGSLYKKQKKLTNGTGKVKFITIHNTADLDNVNDDGEQYTRATYNENMGSARVHFYVDEICAWQNLKAGTGLCDNDPVKSAEVGWHAGDGSTKNGGNMTSLGIEVIMNGTAAHDRVAKDNAARMVAWLLNKHGLTIDNLVTHTYWVNKTANKIFADVDEQCTNPIYGEKWCPAYIFGSTGKKTAYKNWKAFKDLVKKYVDALNGKAEPISAKTVYCVQAGAFETKNGASTQLRKIQKAGFSACIVEADGLYKIQVGAYTVKENANTTLDKLKKAGFDGFVTVKKTAGPVPEAEKKSVNEIANEVIAGKWGAGAVRMSRLKAAGYSYDEVQSVVNKMLSKTKKK